MLRLSKPRNPELDKDPKGSELRMDIEGLLHGAAEQQANPFYVVYNNQRYYGSSPDDLKKTLRNKILGTPPSRFGINALKTTVKKAAAGVANITRRATDRTKRAASAAYQSYKTTKASTLSRISQARQTFGQQFANTRSRAAVSSQEGKRKALTSLGYYRSAAVPRTQKARRTGSVAAKSVANNLNPSAIVKAPELQEATNPGPPAQLSQNRPEDPTPQP